ncbi:hypothetical protein H1C71_001670 [Ictidomys tridecemlineatus]|nr:hypothetical protein H1C71_001670 [Ictidomys tridecemlineatus]
MSQVAQGCGVARAQALGPPESRMSLPLGRETKVCTVAGHRPPLETTWQCLRAPGPSRGRCLYLEPSVTFAFCSNFFDSPTPCPCHHRQFSCKGLIDAGPPRLAGDSVSLRTCLATIKKQGCSNRPAPNTSVDPSGAHLRLCVACARESGSSAVRCALHCRWHGPRTPFDWK